MIDFLIYQGKAAVALAAFYMFYRLLLSKETFHRFNRVVLLGTAAISFILPLCVITIQKVEIMEAYQPAQDYTVMTDIQASAEILETEATTEEPAEETPWWLTALATVFALGVVTIIATTLISINRIKKIISGGRHELLESGEILVITDYDTAPFSWMKYIVLSKEDYESGYSQILTHEKAHIALRHSWDILFVDMITALQWFNPAIWMLKADLRAIHEYEADDAVLRSGANVKEYQYLLIRKAVSKSGYSVANSFNHSTLKARITMMLKKKSSRMSAWKALYVIPLVGISLAATAETKVDYQYEDLEPLKEVTADQDTTVRKVSENWQNEMSAFTKKNVREGRFIVDTEKNEFTLIYFDTEGKELQVHYTGVNLNQDIHMLNGAIVSKEVASEAAKNDPEGVMIVAYLKDNHRVCAAVTTSGDYITGTVKPLQINLTEMESKPKNKKEPVPFHQVAQTPTFNGGDANEFSKWVSENFKYPDEARQSKVQGRVTVQFTVTETGKVADVKVLRSVNEILDKEAIRIVSQSPQWAPGRDENGEIVPVSYVFPVIFKL